MQWFAVALVYVSYLAVTSFTRPAFARARRLVLAAAATAWALAVFAWTFDVSLASLAAPLQVVLPALVLLTGYWLSGLFFVAPDRRLEDWLRRVDEATLGRSGALAWFARAPRVVREYFELSYVLVYVTLPAGAITLLLAGREADVARFWTTVLAAEFTCYGMLPWLPTRPPRSLEAPPRQPPPASYVRRLNLGIANRASIQVNTLPSGHAAGAVATALCVGSSVPDAGAAFLIVAASITVATVAGRYHYLVDSVFGALVGVAAWVVFY